MSGWSDDRNRKTERGGLALGVLLIVGGACYLVDTLALFLAPGFGKTVSTFVVIPSTIAEVWMVGYLLLIGVRTAKPVAQSERECGGAGQPACELHPAT